MKTILEVFNIDKDKTYKFNIENLNQLLDTLQ